MAPTNPISSSRKRPPLEQSIHLQYNSRTSSVKKKIKKLAGQSHMTRLPVLERGRQIGLFCPTFLYSSYLKQLPIDPGFLHISLHQYVLRKRLALAAACTAAVVAASQTKHGKQKRTWVYLQVPIAGALYGELEILYMRMSGGFVGRQSLPKTVSLYYIKSYVVSSVCTPTR